MSFFWLWNPTLSASEAQFEITAGNTLDPDALTPADVQRCLGVAGLRGSVRGVEMRRARSAFFTSYGDSEDWRDRWTHAWHVRLTGDFERVRPFELPAGLHALDDLDHPTGWGEEHEGPAPALLVVGGLFASAGALESLALEAFASALGCPRAGSRIEADRPKIEADRSRSGPTDQDRGRPTQDRGRPIQDRGRPIQDRGRPPQARGRPP